MKMNKTTIVSTILLTIGPINVYAAENGSSSYPGGASNFGIALYPTQPGNYLQANTVFVFSNSFHDANGDKVDNNFDLTVITESFRFMKAYETKILNADAMVTELILSYSGVYNSFDVNGRNLNYDRHGVTDLFVHPISLQWHVGDHWRWAGSLIFRVPTDSDVSGRRFSVQPTLGFKYKHDTGVELAVLPRISFNSNNTETNYKTGPEIFVDYMLSHRTGKLHWGISGYYSDQFKDDEKNGVKIKNSKTSGFGIGPGLRYYHGPFVSSLNWVHDIMAKNKSKNDSITYAIAFAY
jgi:hypothetical protein